MKCPECGKEMKKGFVEAREAGSITQMSTFVTWYPDEVKGKKFKTFKDHVDLRINGEGYYCDECMKVFAVFEQKR